MFSVFCFLFYFVVSVFEWVFFLRFLSLWFSAPVLMRSTCGQLPRPSLCVYISLCVSPLCLSDRCRHVLSFCVLVSPCVPLCPVVPELPSAAKSGVSLPFLTFEFPVYYFPVLVLSRFHVLFCSLCFLVCFLSSLPVFAIVCTSPHVFHLWPVALAFPV